MNSSEETSPRVYIILLNYNGWQDTVDCLHSLKNITYSNFYVVVVDNASIDGSVAKIKQWTQKNCVPLTEYFLHSKYEMPERVIYEPCMTSGFRGLELICSADNLGFCAGNNVGMEFASRAEADYLLILNNDTVCESSFLEPLVKVAQSENNVGMISGLICYTEDANTIQWGGGSFNRWLTSRNTLAGKSVSICPSKISEVGFLIGCMMLIPVNVWKDVGGFDEQFFLWSEDLDLSIRTKKKCYRLLLVPTSKIFHKVSKSLGRHSPLAYYYHTRNDLLLRKKYLGRLNRIIYLLYFLCFRIARYGYFAFKGRFDLVYVGLCAIYDYFLGHTGMWSQHARISKTPLR